jgi:hypothetical protein
MTKQQLMRRSRMVRSAQLPGIRTGQWYRTSDGRELRIIDMDTDEDAIEIEYRDGDIEELDLESLSEAGLRPIASRSANGDGLRYDFSGDFDADFDSGDYGQDKHTLYDVLDHFEY